MTDLPRRRFLTLAAAAIAAPARASEPVVWIGRALGADARIILEGAGARQAERVFGRVEAELLLIESQFSLHTDSALVRLNRDGRLGWPSAEIVDLFDLSGRVHRATGGVFDPTIQPLWIATATGGDTGAARALTGWEKVRISDTEIRLEPGMALTFNGIAQGAAADRIATLLRAEGFGDVLIDMGEVMALGNRAGRPWRAAVADPEGAEIGRVDLVGRALATSSPMGTRIGAGMGHILHPQLKPAQWSTVAVSAADAATADALSTAFCLMSLDDIGSVLVEFPGAMIEFLI
ncbi:MAG: FAD:protein FMN transferase [Paracoccaceae bacterium]